MARIILALVLMCLVPFESLAAEVKMVFWYPGEAGTTEEAQPVLDEFTNYVSAKLKTAKLSGRYFNTADGGLSYIAKQKPQLAIISYPAWETNRSKLQGAEVWLATNPLPHGQRQESYLLVGRSPSPSPLPQGERAIAAGMTVFSSEPLNADFVKNVLGFLKLKEPKLQQTPQILQKLKAISEGAAAGAAILSPTEGATFKRMTAAWTRSLQVIGESRPVPTARVVLLSPLPKGAENLKHVLLELKNDAEAKDILNELRLTGFSEP